MFSCKKLYIVFPYRKVFCNENSTKAYSVRNTLTMKINMLKIKSLLMVHWNVWFICSLVKDVNTLYDWPNLSHTRRSDLLHIMCVFHAACFTGWIAEKWFYSCMCLHVCDGNSLECQKYDPLCRSTGLSKIVIALTLAFFSNKIIIFTHSTDSALFIAFLTITHTLFKLKRLLTFDNFTVPLFFSFFFFTAGPSQSEFW